MCILKWSNYHLSCQKKMCMQSQYWHPHFPSLSIHISLYYNCLFYNWSLLFSKIDKSLAFLLWLLYKDDLYKIFISDIKDEFLWCPSCLQRYGVFRERPPGLNFQVGKIWILIPALFCFVDLSWSTFLSFTFSIVIWIRPTSYNCCEIKWGWAPKKWNHGWFLLHATYFVR